MQRVRDFNSSSRALWMARNPDAFMVHQTELFRGLWDDVAARVNDSGESVVLMSKREMAGLIVPAAFLYEFHRKMPHLTEYDPIIHVSQNDFKVNFPAHRQTLVDGGNIVVLGDDKRPVFGIASKGFCINLKVSKGGLVDFDEEMGAYMFNDRFFDPATLDNDQDIDPSLKYLIADAQAFLEETVPKMTLNDVHKVRLALERMNAAGATRNDLHTAVQDCRFEP